MNIINTQIFNDTFYQKTIKSPISFNGVGIHTGKVVDMTILRVCNLRQNLEI